MSWLDDYRTLLVGLVFIGLLLTFIGSVIKGRRIIATEKTDLVFGNPNKALGGWYWIITGVSFLLLIWFYFSWDAARAFRPQAANELCQVAKVESAVNPMRSLFPLDNRNLRGTDLLVRDQKQLNQLQQLTISGPLSAAQKQEVNAVITGLRAALLDQANPAYMLMDTQTHLNAIAQRIDALSKDFANPNFLPRPAAEQIAAANSQPGWGRSGKEIPVLPVTDIGYRYDAVATKMKSISRDFTKIRNQNPHLVAQVADLDARIKALKATNDQFSDGYHAREKLYRQLSKMVKRIDDGAIFPPNALDSVQKQLVAFNDVHINMQGSLRHFDTWAMPGGRILAGNDTCSEQGSGRWLPKPSDTLATLMRISDPSIGYKDIPLLWYKWKPVGEMIAFLIPDWIVNVVPGDFPRHGENGSIQGNFKSWVHDVATGNYNSVSVPIPMGHMWDSIIRVLVGLFFGIALGVPLGLFMGLNRFAKGFFDPMIELYRPVPPLAWAPLILTIFGIQDDGKIFLLFMVAFAIMVISARTGATGTQLSKIHAAHSLGASHRQILYKVILPNSLPEILTGIRIAIGVCWGTLVAAEMLAGTTGIGFVENVARKQSDYEVIWVTIIILGVLGLAFDIMMRIIIDKTIPWRGKG